jgi:hypothetical protein
MKRPSATIAIFLTAAALLAATGCRKHKPDLPPQSQAPTVADQPPQPPPANNHSTTPDNTSPQPPVRPPKAPVHSPHTPPTHKPAPAGDKPQDPEVTKVTPPAPPRIVIQQGGANDPPSNASVTPLLAHDDTAHNQASTAQLMDSTEANLGTIKRQLSADEQSIVLQVRDYMKQSKQATTDGDLLRARNLALKAHLLSDELVKQR